MQRRCRLIKLSLATLTNLTSLHLHGILDTEYSQSSVIEVQLYIYKLKYIRITYPVINVGVDTFPIET